MTIKVELGQTVKDPITGITGVAIGRSEWLHGCTHIGVQAKVKKDGIIPDVVWVDEPQLEVVAGRKKAKKGSDDNGGPLLSIPTQR